VVLHVLIGQVSEMEKELWRKWLAQSILSDANEFRI
jgi:hypothetical protein